MGRSTLTDPDDPRHGTYNAYTNLGCHCDACRAAATAEVKRMRANRAAKGLPPDDPRHGQPWTYKNHGCKCAACCDAQRQYQRSRAKTSATLAAQHRAAARRLIQAHPDEYATLLAEVKANG